jgi:pimeloyl-ACP methyl ester carboxylesterase
MTLAAGTPRPFKVAISQDTINAIMAKVAAFHMPDAPEDGGWAYGAEPGYMAGLIDYWKGGYDWWAAQDGLNRFPQFTATVGDLEIHFVHEKGSQPAPRALILSHGWPGSYFEFLHLVEPLAHPERFGGKAEDGFDIIVPSLPGYGFSGKPKKPISPRTIAAHFDALMTGSLGYATYLAQGGDWGSAVSGWLAYEGKGCAGAHLNMLGWRSPGVGPETDEEKAQAMKAAGLFEAEGAYFRMHSTKPTTLAYALMDSPVGTCAWIVEKFHGWSDLRGGGIEAVYTKDQLLTNVMIYLVSGTFATSTWLYRGLFEDQSGTTVPLGARIEKPMGLANFPIDIIPTPPRSMVERMMNIIHWTDMAEGGHFAALEKPDLLLGEIRAFAKAAGF